MTIATVKVSEKGQIAIPQSIRESIGITKGDDLVILQIGGKLLIEKSRKVEQSLKDNFRDIIKFNEASLREVWDNKEDDVWSSYLK
jgi:AbrB family looped-hinge helix DNA binding protein